MDRRRFLTATAMVSAITLLPRHVLGGAGQTPPSEKVNIAGIGVGGMGGANLQALKSQNIVALCDVDHDYAAHTFKAYPNAKLYTDYREMLDKQKDIEAVLIATPDHTHALISMAAMKAGKHVYCQKPLTHDVYESRMLAKAAKELGVVTQMGIQGHSTDDLRTICEWIWDGAIGEVREVDAWCSLTYYPWGHEGWSSQWGVRPKETPPLPAKLNWDLWLGPAPLRPYHPAYLPFKWRGWWDFGTGALGDIGCHAMDPVFRALKLSAPLSVQAASTRVNEESYPLGSMVTYHFPARSAAPQANNCHVNGLSGAEAGGVEMPPCKLVWYDGGLRPPRPEALPEGKKMGDNGRLLVGEKGFILDNNVYPQARAAETAGIPKTIPRVADHYKEWIAACKGGKKAGSNFDFAGPLAESVLLGNVALRVQLREDLTLGKLLWDPAALKFTNLEEANKFVRTEYRAGWSL